MIDVRVNELGDEEWDHFVLAHPEAGWCHLAAWRSVVRDTYGFATYYFSAWEGKSLVGVLPTVYVTSHLFGRHLVSMPYLDGGGPLVLHEQAEHALLEQANAKVQQLGGHIEIRSNTQVSTDLNLNNHKVTMKLDVCGDLDAMWQRLPATRRNRIRKAESFGVRASLAGPDALPDFYRLFARNMRDLGSPVHSMRFFEALLSSFSHITNIILARDDRGTPIGAGLYVHFRDTVALPWVSSQRTAFHLGPNMVLYWEAIRNASQNGANQLDYGRSSVNSGTYEFKRQWGAKPHPLYWYRATSKNASQVNHMTNSTAGQTAAVLWKLLPLPLANVLGPRLRRSITL